MDTGKPETLEIFPGHKEWAAVTPDGAFGPELQWWRDGWLVIGTDEAGRGPLAGPVVAAAATFHPDVRIEGIDDSKRLSPGRREELERQIREKALAWKVAEVSAKRIDKINILEATREAMMKAVKAVAKILKLDENPGIPHPLGVFADGRIPPLGIGRQVNIIKGDALSFTIGAASILAKVHRDRLMVEMDRKYPGYGFAQHKGYGTPQHIEAIRQKGYCPIHRRSFHIRALEDTG